MEKMTARIRELRFEKNLTQKQLAKAVNTTDDSIFSWEKGRSQPSYEILVKLADFFNVSADYLLGRTDELGAVVMPAAAPLTDEEREILERYHALRPDLKEAFWITLNALSGTPADVSTKKKA